MGLAWVVDCGIPKVLSVPGLHSRNTNKLNPHSFSIGVYPREKSEAPCETVVDWVLGRLGWAWPIAASRASGPGLASRCWAESLHSLFAALLGT